MLEVSHIKIEKPRMIEIDEGARHSTADDTVFNTHSDYNVLSARGLERPGMNINTTNGIIDGSRGEITPTSSAKSLKSLQYLNHLKHGCTNSAFFDPSNVSNNSYRDRISGHHYPQQHLDRSRPQ